MLRYRRHKKIAVDETILNRFNTWFDQAQFDLDASFISKKAHFYEWSCFQSVQAVEKALKALLIFTKWTPPRTHKLSVLIGLCNNVSRVFRNTKFVFRDLEIFTFIARYPFLVPGEERAPHDFITKDDADSCSEQAKTICDVVSRILVKTSKDKYEDFEHIESIDLQKRLDFVVEKIKSVMNPSKIILFGSYGRGEQKLSTLDILIVADTDLAFLDRVRTIREVTKGGLPAVEPLVYTPQEFNLLSQYDPFLKNAVEEGKVVFQQVA